jgi:hypothetical protein
MRTDIAVDGVRDATVAPAAVMATGGEPMAHTPDWGAVRESSLERATEELRPDMTGPELVEVLRQLVDDMRAIPPRVRAVSAITSTAERLVEVLTDAGVVFANPDMAPGQLGASMLAAWMETDDLAHDTGDWADVFACVPDAIEWAMENGTEAEPWARDTVRAGVGTEAAS